MTCRDAEKITVCWRIWPVTPRWSPPAGYTNLVTPAWSQLAGRTSLVTRAWSHQPGRIRLVTLVIADHC